MGIESRRMAYTMVAACALAASGFAAAQSVTYEGAVKKIMVDRCDKCHGEGAPTLAEFDKDKDGWKKKRKGPRMDTYPALMVMVNGSDAGALMRRLDDGKSTQDGKPGNMYFFLGTSDAERAQRLVTFKEWVGEWNLKRRKDLTEAELKAVKAPEK